MSAQLLLIEDEARIAEFLLQGLSEEGYGVTHAADGQLGWSLLEHGGWDLVVLDWRLPIADGLQLVRRFRLRDSRTPVLFLTARDTIDDRVTGLDAGADDYLCKPFSFAELLARIRSLVRRHESSSSFVLEYQDIQLDLRRQLATRAGQVLDLTAKEILLLLCFLQHPETVLSRSRLYETVWGDTHDGQSNTLEVHIKQLRRKLERFGPRVLHTRRGSGYLLELALRPDARS